MGRGCGRPRAASAVRSPCSSTQPLTRPLSGSMRAMHSVVHTFAHTSPSTISSCTPQVPRQPCTKRVTREACAFTIRRLRLHGVQLHATTHASARIRDRQRHVPLARRCTTHDALPCCAARVC
jgi:hypothetical protein